MAILTKKIIRLAFFPYLFERFLQDFAKTNKRNNLFVSLCKVRFVGVSAYSPVPVNFAKERKFVSIFCSFHFACYCSLLLVGSLVRWFVGLLAGRLGDNGNLRLGLYSIHICHASFHLDLAIYLFCAKRKRE